jgi:ferrous iron transport protein A
MPSLSELPIDRPATVLSLKGERTFRRRLMELGLLPGTSLVVLRRAPLGGVLEVLVRGCRLGLRDEQARDVIVEVHA